MKRVIALLCGILLLAAFACPAMASTGPPKEEIIIAKSIIPSTSSTLVMAVRSPETTTRTASVLTNTGALISKDGVVGSANSSKTFGKESAKMQELGTAIVAMAPGTFTCSTSSMTTVAVQGVLPATDIDHGSSPNTTTLNAESQGTA